MNRFFTSWKSFSLPPQMGVVIRVALIMQLGSLLYRNFDDLQFSGLIALLWMVVLIFMSILLHEGAHAAVGRLYGFRIRGIAAGPLKWDFQNRKQPFHFSAYRMTGGQAILEIPDDMEKVTLRKALLNMFLAGPVLNLLLGATSYVWLLSNPHASSNLLAPIFVWSVCNTCVGLFNIIPRLPWEPAGAIYDGEAVFRLLRPDGQTQGMHMAVLINMTSGAKIPLKWQKEMQTFTNPPAETWLLLHHQYQQALQQEDLVTAHQTMLQMQKVQNLPELFQQLGKVEWAWLHLKMQEDHAADHLQRILQEVSPSTRSWLQRTGTWSRMQSLLAWHQNQMDDARSFIEHGLKQAGIHQKNTLTASSQLDIMELERLKSKLTKPQL